MLRKRWWTAVVTVAVMVSNVPALWAGGTAIPPAPAPAANSSTDALAGTLRTLMLQFIPSPLYEDHKHWGRQKEVTEIKWKGKGVGGHPEKVKVLKNDGHWWKVLVVTPALSNTLILNIRDQQQPEPGRMTFTAFLSFDTAVEYEKQNWHSGLRTWSGSVRARMRINLTLNCEVQSRLEISGGLLPEMVFRLRVLHSDLKYDNLVITHVPGLGGDMAQLVGDALHDSLKHWRPGLERNLLAKANAAITKAADTKEVRLSVLKVMGSK